MSGLRSLHSEPRPIRSADARGAGTLFLGVTRSRVCGLRCLHSGTTRKVTRLTCSGRVSTLSFPHAHPPGPRQVLTPQRGRGPRREAS